MSVSHYEARALDRPCAQTGFTLVEVMVALTILSLIMLATVTGLRTLANTQVAIERMTSRVDEVRTVSGFLRDTLESAVVGATRSRLSLGGAKTESTFFQASREHLAWKATVLFGESYGGSYLVRIGREGDRLVLRWQEPGREGQPGDWRKASSRTLVNDLDDFKLSFRLGFQDPWIDNIDRNTMPALVRLQVKAAGRYWPDLIFRVQRSQ